MAYSLESVYTHFMISLTEALKSNRLQDFIAQQEANGMPPADRLELDKALEALIRSPKLEDQTSHSPSSDGLSET